MVIMSQCSNFYAYKYKGNIVIQTGPLKTHYIPDTEVCLVSYLKLDTEVP